MSCVSRRHFCTINTAGPFSTTGDTIGTEGDDRGILALLESMISPTWMKRTSTSMIWTSVVSIARDETMHGMNIMLKERRKRLRAHCLRNTILYR
ncbi:predicted protein [Sclerotinia sclerotiorum 1980 UF-70]|uniref:Uncharacterized protein n=1 Tax=Sclerotinia sclerotiorum (strain ATCC 18683 / 1980 / Ss-1) TaxID=665079 RepID=A7EGE4_SCLS1|nr:predicted protein [Sclerotinia sclerotiorum 1980 UF-70]EDO01910.1 predicted protein [Sclerotinia sclerotiorum 1980 UF-70]